MVNQLPRLRLSPQQQSLWQRQKGAYRACCVVSIDGLLNISDLLRAVQRVVHRYEILRTTYQQLSVHEMPTQHIADTHTFAWSVIDIQGQSRQAQENYIDELTHDEITHGLSTEQGSALHINLVTLHPQTHILLISLPALSADNETLRNLVQEISEFYSSNRGPDDVASAAFQYGQFSEWQHSLLESNEALEGKNYWTQQNKDRASSLVLPGEQHLSARVDPMAHDLSRLFTLKLQAGLGTQIDALSQHYALSVSAFLQACWQTLLWRLTGVNDIVIRTTFNGRKYEELFSMPGLCTRSLPVRCHFTTNTRFCDIGNRLFWTVSDAESWQDFFAEEPLEMAISSTELPFCFEFEEHPLRYHAADVIFSIQRRYGDFEPFKIKLSCVRQKSDLFAQFSYHPALFTSDAVQRLGEQFHSLLLSVIANPEISINDVNILSQDEYKQLIVDFNQTSVKYSDHLCMQHLFEKQVIRTPENIAVLCEDRSLTYAELNASANQLAHYLQTLGIGPDQLVAVCLERSSAMIICLLGVLKAGGAYVPVDPTYPQSRISFILEDTRAHVLITSERLATTIPDFTGQRVYLDTEWEAIAQESKINPVSELLPEHLAYVIYTSGSTGKPKGIMIPHRGLANYLIWSSEAYTVTEGSGSLVHSSISFDLTITGLFAPLIAGQRITLLPEYQNVETLANALRKDDDFSLIKVTPSHLEALSQLLSTDEVAGRTRAFIIGGEALHHEKLTFWRQHAPATRLINEYGPTETVVGCCTYEVPTQRDDTTQVGSVAIGKPIANTQLYILDAHLQPVPTEMTGDLYIGGSGLARGYLHSPDLTAQSFIPHPFSSEPGSRLYRTRDLARFRPDGNIEFLGRLDSQVKIRGYRIEPGEIEAVLSQHSQVQEALVLLREDTPGDKRLVAYVVPHKMETSREDDPQIAIKQIENFIRERLPDYMMPAVIVLLAALPLTSNGKIDRRVLPAPEQRHTKQESFVAPRTVVEHKLTDLWAEVLNRKDVGIQDNFFELGGHSLLATQLVSRIRSTLQIEVPLSVLFDVPTIEDLAKYIAEVLQTKEDISIPPITSTARDGLLPLSFAQQRLWFLDQFEPGNPAYNIPFAAQLNGKFTMQMLESSLSEIVRRHEILRTTFSTHEGNPIQVIHPTGIYRLPVIDLQGLTPEERLGEVQLLIHQEVQRHFDLTQGPLMQIWLLRLEEQEHISLITMHHIIFDAWSSSIFYRELTALYQAFSRGLSSPLSSLPIQYADYALWQRAWLQGEILQKQLDYWKEHLDGLAPLELPTDFPRPSIQTSRGAYHRIVFPPLLQEHLHALSQREGVTLFMFLLASFQLLLARYSGQDDIAVGTPIANRTHSQLEGLIGFFVNTLVLRTDLSGNLRFSELVQRVREVCLGAYAHQELPFEQLVEVVQPERDLSRTPLFQVLFALQHAGEEVQELAPGLSQQPLPLEDAMAKFDLSCELKENRQELGGWIEYNSDLFEPSTIQRLVGHWLTLLQSIVEHPDWSIWELPLLPSDERKQILQSWNTTHIDYPRDLCLHEVFEQQVEQTPEAIAIVFEEQHLSYRQLNRQANQLAHHLRSLEVGPEIRVGIFLERSLEIVTCLLAILKAGGVCVPLDPTYPTSRLTFMHTDAQIPVLLTHTSKRETFLEEPGTTIYLDSDWDLISRNPTNNPISDVQPENLAYVIYTSGSTGSAKGAGLPHRAVVNRLLWGQQTMPLTSQDRVLHEASFSFDFAIWELYGSWLAGAQLVLTAPGIHRDPTELLHLIEQHSITVAHLIPSLLRVFLQQSDLAACKHLRHVFCGAEALPFDVQESFAARLPAQLHNVYGPTEATIDTTWWMCQPTNTYNERHIVPIGRPIANAQVYLLDRSMQPVPIGVPGEIHVGGMGLARGYITRPELTAERFLPHPFAHQAGERIYKTGDLARYLPDGNLEYLGRADTQVKVRGFRIEPGEVEHVLMGHVAVSECVVLAREDVIEGGCLVAYVVSKTEKEPPSTHDLRHYIQEKLPEYMVPAFIISMKSLPLTASGKVDRRSLPVPDWKTDKHLREDEGKKLLSPVEELVQQSWKQVLQQEQPEVQENFFEIGGHSLLATQVISRLRTALGVNLTVRMLFEAPTISQLAQRVEQELRGGLGLQAPPLLPVARNNRQLPLSFAQQRLWFLDRLEPGSTAYLIPSAYRLQGQLNHAALEQSLQELVRRHESLRTIFAMQADQPVQVIQPANRSILKIIELSTLEKTEREQQALELMMQERDLPFDLQRGPLWRIWLLHLDEQEYMLLITMHHIISDAWSNEIFYRELTALYQAFSEKQPSQLAPLPIQYADFADWQRQWLQGPVLEQQLAYWRNQLAGVPPLELPADHPRPAIKTYHGAIQTLQLPTKLQEELLTLSQREQVTLFMLLLTAFQVLLSRYCGQSDIAVGTPVANRTHKDLEGLIGFFVNTLVLRTQVQNNLNFIQHLTQAREMALGAYTHQDVPFEQLVEMLQPDRDLSRSPLFQVMFGVQQPRHLSAHNGAVPAGNLHSQEMGAEHITTKFDMTWNVTSNPHGMHCTVEYNTDLFEATTLQRWLKHWQRLLEQLVAAPTMPIGQLQLLRAEEVQQLQRLGTGTPAEEAPSDWNILRLVARRTKEQPDALAIVSEETSLSYGALERLSNQLAHRLVQHYRVKAESIVAVAVERKASWLISLLAVLKAGCVYLPLDVRMPQSRQRLLLEQARPCLILKLSADEQEVDAAWTEHGYAGSGEGIPQKVAFAYEWKQWSSSNDPELALDIKQEQLAYIIYTSGSTGKPKGVMVTHHGLGNLALEQGQAFGTRKQSRILQFAAPSFDASIAEIVVSLVHGASLHLISPERLLPGSGLLEALRERAITTITLPPSVLNQVPQETLSDLETLISAGEACSAELVRRWQPGRMFWNAYGPTEVTVCASMQECHAGDQRERTPGIGGALGQVEMYVLDTQGQMQPLGVAGELVIGGIGIARGYLGQAAATAERFVPHPYSKEPGARLYRTGDRVRWQEEGRLEFLGRTDQQIKLRGYRIEPGEVEAVLQGYEGISESVVIVKERSEGDMRMLGYIVPARQEEIINIEHLHEYLRERLPEYMVPGQLVVMEHLPVLPNGKLDRQGLPWPEELEREKEQDEEWSPIEEIMAQVWMEVLNEEHIGRHDNFFDLGGHSLLTTQIIVRVQALLGVEISLQGFFEAPTIAQLTQRVEQEIREGHGLHVPPLLPVEHNGSLLPLSFAQQRLWFLDQLEPENNAYLIPAFQRLQGALDMAALECSLEELIRRHEILRTTFPTHNNQPVQVIHPAGTYRLPLIDLQGLAPEVRFGEARQLAEQELQKHFDLAKGPLLQIYLLRLGEREHIALTTMHHIVSDAWSNKIFYQELTTLYYTFVHKQPSSLPPLTIQYADYAIWQKNWLQGDILQAQIDYWKQQLAEQTPLDFPTDYPRPMAPTFRGAYQRMLLPPSLQSELNALCRQANVTLFMLLLAAFQTLLARYTGQDDISIGAPIAGRTHIELEKLIGFFINTLVLRTDLSGNPTFLELLERVRTMALGAYAHQDVPFDLLVEELHPRRDLSRSPLFQVMFGVEQATDTQSIHRLDRPEEIKTSFWTTTEHTKAHFDLTFGIVNSVQGLHCSIEYDVDLFEDRTIQQLLEHWLILLRGIVATPQARLADLPLLTENERRALLSSNTTIENTLPDERCLPDLFEAQVARTPDAIAIVSEKTCLSFANLNRHVNQMAQYLQAIGVAPEVLVGVSIERSAASIICLLAVLKAGGTYVPLDPDYPLARQEFIVNDARLSLLLTRRTELELSVPPETKVIHLNQIWSSLEQQSQENPISNIHVDNAAYIIYTSGSTGAPKGVAVTHRGLGNLAHAQAQAFAVDVESHVLQFASLNFDASISEIVVTLLAGASLYLASQEQLLPGPKLLALLQEQSITVITLPPSALAILPIEPLPALATLVVAGEACSAAQVNRWATGRRFCNAYGPTETTVCASIATCIPDLIHQQKPGIGKPLANTQVYILDKYLQPVPAGVPGELYIGGIGIARGYLRRPELTAERFIPHPFSTSEGARLYRTGDRVRMRIDGSLDFLGRLDNQIKVRGYRIETGEIEAALNEHPAVRDAVVLLHEDDTKDSHLVAHVVIDEQQLLKVERELFQLPNHMHVFHLDRSDSLALYHEVFTEQSYLKHGIKIAHGDCIFDVGANIGFFTLFVHQMCSDAQVYAFEPIPPIFETLQGNIDLYGLNTRLFQCGLSNETKSAQFTFYPHFPAMSGKYADAQQDEALARATLGNQDTLLTRHIDELLADRFISETVTCQLRTLSEVIRENAIQQIDLLKIDVEKSELDVLSGIQEEDWQKIAQLVIEIHDLDGRLLHVSELLAKHGYHISIEQGDWLANTQLYTIYAHRHPQATTEADPSPEGIPSEHFVPLERKRLVSVTDLRYYLQEKLPDYMIPSIFVALEALPLLPNGKINRSELRLPEPRSTGLDTTKAPARMPIEEIIAKIWCEVLGDESIGIHENFFDLGGHSLLAAQIIARVQATLGVDVPLQHMFEAPTIAAMAQQVEQALREQSGHQPPPLIPVPRIQPLPLSFAQQRLWLVDQLDPGNIAYNISLALRIQGALNRRALHESLHEILRRHEILRTSFPLYQDQPVQHIGPAQEYQLRHIDLTALPAGQREALALDMQHQERLLPFDLQQGPLVRFTLIWLDKQTSLFVSCMHHIISDGWSNSVLARELSTLYHAYSHNLPSPLPQLPVQYADYAAWQRSWLQGEVLQQQLDYWHQQLAGAHPCNLPTDFPRPLSPGAQGDRQEFLLPATLTQELRTLSRQHGTTLFMTLLAALQVLLYRWSGEHDLVIGTDVANRNPVETEQLIGFFINLLALRTKVQGQASFSNLLTEVRETVLQAYLYQETPFEMLVEQLQLERRSAQTPLVQVLFVLQNLPPSQVTQAEELHLSPVEIGVSNVKFDLAIFAEEEGAELRWTMSYRRELFRAETIERLMQRFESLLHQITANPEIPVDLLDFLTPSEQEHLITRGEDHRRKLKITKGKGIHVE